MTEGRARMEERRLRGCAMIASGAVQAIVVRACGVSRTTASRWARAVAKGADLRARKPRPARLTPEQVRGLHLLWESRARWTYTEFAEAIRQAYGVSYDADHVGRLAIRFGLRVKRAKRQITPEEFGKRFEALAHHV